MPNNLDEPTERIHCHIYKRDIARIHALRGNAKFNKVVRNIIRSALDAIEAKALRQAAPAKAREEDFGLQ